MSPSETFIHFGCPHCTGPLKAPATHVGRQQRCPLCQWAVEVPQEGWPAHVEQYDLHDDSRPTATSQPEIAVGCPVCHTRMTAPETQIGQQIVCPDCGTRVVIPPKAEPVPRKPMVPLEAYALCEDYDPASFPSGIQQEGRACGASERSDPTEYIAVYCGLCGTLIQATPDQAGREVTCPDCGRPVLVPPPVPKPRHDPLDEIDGEYDLAKGGETFERPLPTFRPPWAGTARAEGRLPSERPAPPRWPLLSGVFNFPCYRTTWMRWLSLSACAAPIAYLAYAGWCFARGIGAGAGMAGLGPMIVGLMFTSMAVCMAVAWFAVMSVNLLAIVWDTAAGNDIVESWPDAFGFIDWAGSTFFVINSAALAALAGLGLGWLMDCGNLPGWSARIAVPLALFPPLLISMLEMNSATAPFSPAVCRSLVSNWRAWVGFYLETTFLLAAAGGVLAAVPLPGKPLLEMFLAAAVIVATLMIYFRLLGRLAWCCSFPRPGDVVR
jgi:DNA-directed RNA polymerase subunit RPC12/RpoP